MEMKGTPGKKNEEGRKPVEGGVPAAVEARVLWLRTTFQKKEKEKKKKKRYQRNFFHI